MALSNLISEEWRELPGYNGIYEISTDGAIRSGDTAVPSFVDNRGKLKVELINDCDNKAAKSVAKLVAAAFMGPNREKRLLIHKDGNPRNCALDNLDYMEVYRERRNCNYITDNKVKLTPEDVRFIRQSLSDGEATQAELAEKYNVTESYISMLCRRLRRQNIPDTPI